MTKNLQKITGEMPSREKNSKKIDRSRGKIRVIMAKNQGKWRKIERK